MKKQGFLKNRPIRSKLERVILSTSVLTIILVFAGFFIYEHITYKDILVNDLSAKADIIAENSNAALTFRDSTDAARVLNSLASQPHVIAAAIYDSAGIMFASYIRKNESASFPENPVSSYLWRFEDNALIVYRPITLNEVQIGTIYLSKDLAGQENRFWSYIQIALLVLIGSLIAAYVVATILAKNISAPIINLSQTAQQVSEHRDYSIRASRMTNDETGLLADSFNKMLFQIQEHDENLREKNEALKINQEALQESERRYRTIFETVTVSIWEEDFSRCKALIVNLKAEGITDIRKYLAEHPEIVVKAVQMVKVLGVNKQSLKLFGAKSEEEILTSLNRTFVPETLSVFAEEMVAIAENKRYFESEAIVQTLQGERRNVLLTIPFPEPGSSFDRVMVTLMDITERKQAEKALKKLNEELEQRIIDRTDELETANKNLIKAQDFLNSIVENIPSMIFLKDAKELRFVRFNKAGEDLIGFSREDLIGKNDHDFFPKEEADFFTSKDREVLTGDKVIDIPEEPIQTKNKGLRFLHTKKISLRNEQGEPQYLLGISEDITEQKLIEQVLRENQERIRQIIDTAHDAFIAIDENGLIADWNHQAEITFGWIREEIIGKQITETIMPMQYREEHKKGLNRFLTTGNGKVLNKRLELSALNRDGQEFPIELTIAPVKTGGKYLFSAFARDISERKLFDEERKKSQERIEGLLNFTPDSIVAVDEKGKIALVNNQTEKLFGYSREELLGRPLELLLPDRFRNIHTQHRFSYFRSPRVREMGIGLDLFGKRKDGTEFPLEISLSPFEAEEGTLAISAIRDITDRKRSEQEIQRQRQGIRDFIDSMSTLCAKVATDGTILMVNKTAQQASGLTMEDLLKTNFLEGQWFSFDPVVLARVKESFQKACSGTIINYDERIFVFNQILTINFSIIPIFETGKVAYLIVEGRDITPLKKAEESLQERTVQLENANKELQSFSYSVSHDLRAPLRAINGYTKMLEEDYANLLDQEGKRLLFVIKDNANRMASLIDDLLALSRLGRKEVQKSLINMTELTQRVLFEISNTLNLSADVKIHKLHPVMADYSLMNHVITNLLSNSLKYSSKVKKPRVEIKSEKKNEHVIYSIKDNGAGFDMQYAHKLFGVFQRLHTTNEFEGTGVGLAIVNLIIRKHNGKVWAEGKLNEGATFYFSLPAGHVSNTQKKLITNNNNKQ